MLALPPSVDVHQGPVIGCSGRNGGGGGGDPEPLSCSRGAEDLAQAAPMNQKLCIPLDLFRPKPVCSSLAENELHQCHPQAQPG